MNEVNANNMAGEDIIDKCMRYITTEQYLEEYKSTGYFGLEIKGFNVKEDGPQWMTNGYNKVLKWGGCSTGIQIYKNLIGDDCHSVYFIRYEEGKQISSGVIEGSKLTKQEVFELLVLLEQKQILTRCAILRPPSTPTVST